MLEIFISAAAGAAVTGTFTVIVWMLNRGAAKADRQLEEDKNEGKALEDRLSNIESCIEALVVAERRAYYDRIKSHGKEYIARGEVTTEEFEDFLAMHKIYHDTLKGNGFLDDVVKDVRRLRKI